MRRTLALKLLHTLPICGLLLLLTGTSATAQGSLSPAVQALLNGDVGKQWDVLAEFRGDPAEARTSLLAALQLEEPLPERWKLAHRLAEFGVAEDIPVLLGLREAPVNDWEKRIAEGSARALYRPVTGGVAPEGLVQDFSFVQTGLPVVIQDSNRSKWLITRWSLGEYHRTGIPLNVIQRLQQLRGKGFGSKDAVAEAAQKQLSNRDWKAYGEQILKPIETVPRRQRLQGFARVGLYNPLQQTLLLRVSINAWFGGFHEPPPVAWVYLEPGVNRIVDLPVSPLGSDYHERVRLDLRLSEINGEMLPGFHKLYLPILR